LSEYPPYVILAALAHPSLFMLARADAAREGLAIEHIREMDHEFDEEPTPPRAGLPRLTTFEVVPKEIGPDGVRLDEASRAKIAAAGADPDKVERELHGMRRGDRKELAEVVFGVQPGAPRADVDEQLRWFGIAPTEEEEERIARGETVTFLLPADGAPA
jgi:hypothetical protein